MFSSKWLDISNYIRNEVKSGKINLDEQIFSQLLYSEQKLENWNGVLTAYTLLSIYDQTEVEKLDALINQAKAAEKLGIFPSLALGGLAAWVRQNGYPVQLIDLHVENLYPNDITGRVIFSTVGTAETTGSHASEKMVSTGRVLPGAGYTSS